MGFLASLLWLALILALGFVTVRVLGLPGDAWFGVGTLALTAVVIWFALRTERRD